MTLLSALLTAIDDAPCVVYLEDRRCGDSSNLSTGLHRQHPKCVAAAVMRVLLDDPAVVLVDAEASPSAAQRTVEE